MPINTRNIINDFILETRKVLGNSIKKIILYGSYARGDYNKSSDIDIMILIDLEDEKIEEIEERLVDIAFEIELKTKVMISPIVRNIDTYQKRTTFHPFYINVEREGVELNG